MDGIEATKEIRKLEKSNNIGVFPSTPSTEPASLMVAPTNEAAPPSPFRSSVIIVALTASSLQSDRVTALAAGCNDFLTKPVSLKWLERKIIEWGCMQVSFYLRFTTFGSALLISRLSLTLRVGSDGTELKRIRPNKASMSVHCVQHVTSLGNFTSIANVLAHHLRLARHLLGLSRMSRSTCGPRLHNPHWTHQQTPLIPILSSARPLPPSRRHGRN